MLINERTAQRFWKKVQRLGENECWEWLGYGVKSSTPGKIYRRKRVNGRTEMPTRISWMIHHGVDPGDLDVLHNCPGADNPQCVNPTHLWLGTDTDNQRDCRAKGRTYRAVGELAWLSKLTWPEVREIRRLRMTEGRTLKSLAAQFGVYFSTIHKIVTNQIWIEYVVVSREEAAA